MFYVHFKNETAYNCQSVYALQAAIARVMKAIRVQQFGGPEVLKVVHDVPIPKPGDHDVLIHVKAVGVNPVETYIRSGIHSMKPDLPYTPGNDCAGVVEEVGGAVKNVKKGDHIYSYRSLTGTYAEFTISPASDIHILPNALTFAQGAALGIPYHTAYRGLFQKAKAKVGETVLVHGASGGVGTAAVQFCQAYGVNVVGTAGTPEGMELVKKAGAQSVFNHREAGYVEQLLATTGGRGFDVILENAAHINLGVDLTLLAPNGRVVVVGSRGKVEIMPRETMFREASIIGVTLFRASREESTEAFAAIQAGILNGWLRPAVGKVYPLEKASDAHVDIISGPGALGKLVLEV